MSQSSSAAEVMQFPDVYTKEQFARSMAINDAAFISHQRCGIGSNKEKITRACPKALTEHTHLMDQKHSVDGGMVKSASPPCVGRPCYRSHQLEAGEGAPVRVSAGQVAEARQLLGVSLTADRGAALDRARRKAGLKVPPAAPGQCAAVQEELGDFEVARG